MMLALGMFVFMRQTLPFQSMDRNTQYRWPTNNRVGRRATFQFLGPDTESVSLKGTLYPEVTGGTLTMAALRLMAAQGRAWPLISGNGAIHGMFIITGVTENRTELLDDGSPRKIDFTLALTRVDPSLSAMFGDIKKQAEDAIALAGDAASAVSETLGING